MCNLHAYKLATMDLPPRTEESDEINWTKYNFKSVKKREVARLSLHFLQLRSIKAMSKGGSLILHGMIKNEPFPTEDACSKESKEREPFA